MLGKKTNKIYDPFLKAGLGYQNHERLKKAIAAQPKMYDGDMLNSDKLKIHSPDSEETLKDAKEIRNQMKDKIIQVNYDKINGLYETFVPQQELSAEQTYFSIPSTSNNSSESKDIPSESPVLKMPNENRLLKKIDKLGDALSGFYTNINKTLLKDAERRWLSDRIDRLLEVSLTSEIRDCALLSAAKQTHDLLKDELEKSSNGSKEIQANLLHIIKILENDFQRSQAQSQVESVVQECKNIKLEFQELFNSIKLVLWIVDRGCSKHMTGNLQLLRNFVEKFMGTVRFGNDHFAAVCLMSRATSTSSRDSNLYTIFNFEIAASSPMYYLTSSHEVSDDSNANTTDNDHTSSSSSIIVDQDDAPPVVSLSDEQIANAPNSPVMNEVADEFVQEDVADFDGYMFHDAPQTPEFEVAESSSTYQDPSNMH
ncbi:hypothetical protein Tco_0795598 [Tanacetum coccineum]